MNYYIHNYVRRGERGIVGCVMAMKPEGTDTVFISGGLCHRNDDFKKEDCIGLASQRIHVMATEGRECVLPLSLQKHVEQMQKRAARYFKDAKAFVVSPCVDKTKTKV